jgi:hypothetical protein
LYEKIKKDWSHLGITLNSLIQNEGITDPETMLFVEKKLEKYFSDLSVNPQLGTNFNHKLDTSREKRKMIPVVGGM